MPEIPIFLGSHDSSVGRVEPHTLMAEGTLIMPVMASAAP